MKTSMLRRISLPTRLCIHFFFDYLILLMPEMPDFVNVGHLDHQTELKV